VSRVRYGRAAPASSTVRARAGDVEGDLAEFFASSDQVESIVRLQAGAGGAGAGAFCGGVLVQRLAASGGRLAGDASEWAPFDEVARSVQALSLPSLGGESADGGSGGTAQSLEDVAWRLLRRDSAAGAAAPEPAAARRASTPLDFFCRCTKARFVASALSAGGPELLRGLLREHSAAAHEPGAVDDGEGATHDVCDVVTTFTCAACNRRHLITRPDLEKQLASPP
jgi:hypothetical protein